MVFGFRVSCLLIRFFLGRGSLHIVGNNGFRGPSATFLLPFFRGKIFKPLPASIDVELVLDGSSLELGEPVGKTIP